MNENTLQTEGENNAAQNGMAKQPAADTKKNDPKVSFPIIVIGASAGGFNALKTLIAALPKELGAAILIVWHMSPDVRGILPEVISRLGTLPASHAADYEKIVVNHIYIAPPDHHLIVEVDYMRVTKGPKENLFRPAVDPLFRSAAFAYGRAVIGVILTGALDDGTSGLWMVKHRGGTAIVQHPADAEMPSMPSSALKNVEVDYALPLKEIPPLLVNLVKDHAITPKQMAMSNDTNENIEVRIAADEADLDADVFSLGELTRFTCPECHGVLTSIIEGRNKRFRCHTGHALSVDSLLAALSENIEENIWNAIRSIRESTMLLNHIGDHFAEHNDAKRAALYFRKAKEADKRAREVRDVITKHEQLNPEEIKEEEETQS